MKVKTGLERFLNVASKLNQRAYTNETMARSNEMLDDCKARIALLRMEIERIKMKENAGNNFDGSLLFFFDFKVKLIGVQQS